MTYYNQRDYGRVAYPSSAYPSATVASSGCGPCCMSMVVENLGAGAFPPPASAAFALSVGARASSGTNMEVLGRAAAAKFGLLFTRTSDAGEAEAAVKSGKIAIVNVKGNTTGHKGLFSDGGHYVVLAAIEGNTAVVLDPYLYPGKFDKTGRKGKVSLKGNEARCALADLEADAKGYYVFGKKVNQTADIKESSVKVCGVSVPSLLRDGRNYVELRPMIDAINRGIAFMVEWDAREGACVKAGEDA